MPKRKRKWKSKKRNKPPAHVDQCRDCGHRQKAPGKTSYKSIGFARRCEACGGMVDRVGADKQEPYHVEPARIFGD